MDPTKFRGDDAQGRRCYAWSVVRRAWGVCALAADASFANIVDWGGTPLDG